MDSEIGINTLHFSSSGRTAGLNLPPRPQPKYPIILAVGGPSGAGKTAIVRQLKHWRPGGIITHPAFTTRPIRPGEQDGDEYHFRTVQDMERAKTDPHCTNFVEARGRWYWINLSRILETIWLNLDKVQVFFISQRHDFESRQTLFPDMRWVWIESDQVEQRLRDRGDENIESSIEYNRCLASQSIDDLVDLRVQNPTGALDVAARNILDFCAMLQQRRS